MYVCLSVWQRLEYFKERFHSMPEEDKELGLPPPFLYGTHYSTPGYVLFYLVSREAKIA